MGRRNARAAPRENEHETLLRLVYGAQSAQIIYVGAKLELPDLLAAGPMSTGELAALARVDEVALRRLLRALASLGVCAEVERDRFALTETGRYLRSDHPRSLRARILFNTEILQPIWQGLVDTIRTGKSGTLRTYGMPFYEFLQQHADAGRLFDRAMSDAVRYRVEAALDAYDFSRFRKIVDIGGGDGSLILAILKRWAAVEGVVFDLPPVAERAKRGMAPIPESARCTVVAGNALERVTDGGDCYVMSNFLVSIDDAQAAGILQNCRRAMAPGGKVVIIDWVMPTIDEYRDPFARWDTASMDLNMLALHGERGWRVRTRDEFRLLVEAGGLTLETLVATRSSVSVLECMAL